MKLKDFDYNLPKELIAQKPIKPRDHSRLLVLDKKSGQITDQNFYDIVDYLHAGDVLVLNNSKVFPARLIGQKKDTGGKIEIFLLRRERGAIWQCLLGGHGCKENLEIKFTPSLKAQVKKNNHDGTWQVKFNQTGKALMAIVDKIGLTPLPPYIKRESRIVNRESHDNKNYQTVYADESKRGSVAAPTAGFHFTPQLLNKLKDKGVEMVYVTLHVGLGTFAPVKTEDITKHKMHAELVEVKAAVINKILKAKIDGRRVIAVGTTSARTLEAIASEIVKIPNSKFKIQNLKKWVNIFIYPGYNFKIVDGLITNFHLPKSTLLMLVNAFAGREEIKGAYKYAIKKKYRFYSYGDAMMII